MPDAILDPGQIATRALALEPGDHDRFDELARAAFLYQSEHNDVYGRFVGDRGWDGVDTAPYLPIAAFKEAVIVTFNPDDAERVFLSSATGSAKQSRHFVRSLDLYRRTFETGFQRAFGRGPFTLVALLPHYTEQAEHSSLVYMVDGLIQSFGDDRSGFFLDDVDALHKAIEHSRRRQTSFILFGAAFGLLDLIEATRIELPGNALVIETGGMKTFRREITRAELHDRLSAGLGVARSQIRSEYGMCELLSQCYSGSEGRFSTPPWVRTLVMDPLDPRRKMPDGEPGVLAVFDLANIHTVSAILTEDRAVASGSEFEILGRLRGSELRGCNFLLESAAPVGSVA